jgi:hypothetical protein
MLEVKNGKVVEVSEVEVDVLAIKAKIATLRNIADTHNAAADELEASLAVPEVAAVVASEEAKVEAEKVIAEPVVVEEEPVK